MASEQARHIGERIRARRKELGMETQRELADKIGQPTITNQVISNWERGVSKPSDENIRRLADALEVEPGYFYAKKVETPDLMATFSPSDLGARLQKIDARLAGMEEAQQGLADMLAELAAEVATLPKRKPGSGSGGLAGASGG